MRFTALIIALIITQFTARASDLTAETAKQVLDQSWQGLRPQGYTERNVLFQSMRPLGPNRFSVTALIRDYEPGYPANRYYGNTCVSHFDDADFSFRFDGAKWHAEGALTPPMAKTQCQKNPSAGVSSQPLASLPGKPAVGGQIAAGPPPTRSSGIVEGSYECWNFNRARAGLNFKILSGGRYTDSEGTAGSFSVNPADKRVTFRGGLLAALGEGFSAFYHEPKWMPTLSIRSVKSGAEVSFCERTR